MNQEKSIINILILLAISDDELHKKEREFIQDNIDEWKGGGKEDRARADKDSKDISKVVNKL